MLHREDDRDSQGHRVQSKPLYCGFNAIFPLDNDRASKNSLKERFRGSGLPKLDYLNPFLVY